MDTILVRGMGISTAPVEPITLRIVAHCSMLAHTEAGALFGTVIEYAPSRRTLRTNIYAVTVKAIDGRVWYGRCQMGHAFVARLKKTSG